MENRLCTWCGKEATRQTLRGEQNQKAKGLPQNDSWFCGKCWDEGIEKEREAMYDI